MLPTKNFLQLFLTFFLLLVPSELAGLQEQCIEDKDLPIQNAFLSSGPTSANKYLIDKKKSNDLSDDYRCAHTQVEEFYYPWWQVDLEENAVIDRVIIGGASSKYPKYNVRISSDPIFEDIIELSTENECTKMITEYGFMEYDCGGRTGRYIVINASRNESLVLCEVLVLVLAFDSENIARGKPTNQSSLFRTATSDIAVDGNRNLGGYFYDNWNDLTPQCTHTNDNGEPFPWWTVDLLEESLVDKVVLYNREETLEYRLHDFEIRIGNSDIRELGNAEQRFRKNPICASFIDHYVVRSKEFRCKTPLVGRHLSIQIVKQCSLSACRGEKENILTLCEVEVYGKSLHQKPEESVKLLEMTHFLEESNEANEDIKFPWASIYITKPSVINRLAIITEEDSEGGPVPDFDIQIGNFPITSEYDNEQFKLNILCYRVRNGRLIPGTNDVQCKQPLFGRYITLQVTEPCNQEACLEKLQAFMEIAKIEAFGYEGTISRTIGSLGKRTDQISTLENGYSSLAVDGEIPAESIRKNAITHCARTIKEKYPWGLLILPEEHLVKQVVINLPGNTANGLFKNVEILVTNEPIYLNLNDFGFNSHEITCARSEDKVYAEGENIFQCEKSLKGQYVVIRISNDKADNQLNVCEVEIVGCSTNETETIDYPSNTIDFSGPFD